jgi:phenylalanyl-tRNA synthetase beta chain
LLGTPIEATEMRQLLHRVLVGTEPATEADAVAVMADERPVPLDGPAAAEALVAIIPSHRRDLVIEADIAEEIARVRGYDTVPGRLPDTLMPVYREDPRRFHDAVRDLLSGRGLNEVVAYSLVAGEDHARLGLSADDPATIRAENPVSIDHAELQRSLLPELLRVLVDNERQRRDEIAIFALGRIHSFTDGRSQEHRALGILLSGAAHPLTWDVPARPFDVADAKGLLEWLVERLTDARLSYEPAAVREGVDHPGRTALVVAQLPGSRSIEPTRTSRRRSRSRASRSIWATTTRSERASTARRYRGWSSPTVPSSTR